MKLQNTWNLPSLGEVWKTPKKKPMMTVMKFGLSLLPPLPPSWHSNYASCFFAHITKTMMNTTIGGNAPLPVPYCCPLKIGWPNSINHHVISGATQFLLLLMLFLPFDMDDILPKEKAKEKKGKKKKYKIQKVIRPQPFVTLPSSSCCFFFLIPTPRYLGPIFGFNSQSSFWTKCDVENTKFVGQD